MTDLIALARELARDVAGMTAAGFGVSDLTVEDIINRVDPHVENLKSFAALATFAARIAKAPEDERAAFEKWRLAHNRKKNPDDALALNGFGDDADYVDRTTRAMWTGWRHRASLPQGMK